MDSNSVSPMPDTAPIAEFDKSPPTPPEETLPMDDLPPPPGSAGSLHGDDIKDKMWREKIVEEGIRSSNGQGNCNNGVQRTGSICSGEKSRYDDDNEWGCSNWCEYVIVVVLAALLLIASLTLTLFWIMYYREGFSWDTNPKQQFNLHPVLMVAGFITFSGFSILLYRICRCFRRIYVKLIHTIFHALAIPCIVVGFLAVLEYHNNTDPPIPNFYSMHSWLGFITMGLFALQFVFGFFSFLILLCCEGATAAFRASMVPIHASFGLTTFMLAIATCITGLTEKAIFTLGSNYSSLPEEAIIINSIAMVLTALAIVVSYICMREDFRFRGHVLIRSGDL